MREKYPENDFIFWPDLATAHYARATTQLLDDLDIPFVYKEDNLHQMFHNYGPSRTCGA